MRHAVVEKIRNNAILPWETEERGKEDLDMKLAFRHLLSWDEVKETLISQSYTVVNHFNLRTLRT